MHDVLMGRQTGRPALGSVEHRGASWPAVVADAPPRRLRRIGLLIAAFAVASLAMVVWPGESAATRVVGVAGVALFGGIAAFVLLSSFRPWRIALLEPGLRWELGTGPAFVPWDAIRGVRIHPVQGVPYLAVDVDDRDAIVMPPVRRLQARLERRSIGADCSFALAPFPVDPDRLVEVVTLYADQPELRAELGTPTALERLTAPGVPSSAPTGRGRLRIET